MTLKSNATYSNLNRLKFDTNDKTKKKQLKFLFVFKTNKDAKENQVVIKRSPRAYLN